MDAKVIILLVFILFGMIVAYMVANGMVDLTSIFSRVTKSQAEERLGGVKLEVVSPVAGVYYQTNTEASALDENTLQFDLNGDGDTADSVTPKYIDLTSIVTIKGKNLKGEKLTISVASPNWYIYDGSKVQKTAQLDISAVPFTPSGTLHLIRAGAEPFNMPEFVELIFAVGDTAKAEVTIVAEP